jgi:hypothetical protein
MAICLAVFLAAGGSAQADQTFDFTFSTSGNFITGQLKTTNLEGDAYSIIGVSGTMDGVKIARLAPAGSFFNPNLATDNLLYGSGALVDAGGFIIEPVESMGLESQHVPEQIQETPFVASALPVVVFYDAAVTTSALNDLPGSFTVEMVTAAVPGPGTVALLGVGLVGLAVMRKRVL